MNHIRKAERKDIPSVLRLLVQVNMVHHNGRPDLFKGPATKYAEAQLPELFADPKTPVFVYEDDSGAVRGYVMCVLKQAVNDNILTDIKTLYIDDLCVDEAVRGGGIGKALYEYAVRFARESGCYNVTLNVWTLNPSARRFYEKLGMTPQKIGMEYNLGASGGNAVSPDGKAKIKEESPMERKWWHGKTAYQIYPKSFLDTNGDGIGDLRGIIQKLDYLQELGIGLLWLSPVYRSPLADQGYDISDYYSIDPRFGTMDDMDELLREAKRRDIGIVMDLVVNHCSDEHEWFKKACQDPDGKYGRFFYIEKWKEGEPLPCNWRSYFGGPVWSKLPGHDDRVYLHLFHPKQPDLNWENPEVRKEIYTMINWWLEKGLAGFRIDAIINIKKALPFRNYPADRDDGLSSVDNMLFEAKGVLDFLNEMAEETFRKYDAFTVGEVFNEKPEQLPLFIGDRGCFSTMFDFAETVINQGPEGWHVQKPITAEQYKTACFASQRKTRDVGFLCNIIENHDEPRGVSHYLPAGTCSGPYGVAAKKLLGGLNFMLRGLPFLYQGQEIGMENVRRERIEEVDDIAARDQYRVALEAGLSPAEAMESVNRFSRDNARTPFQWSADKNAGFTVGVPWLSVNPNCREINLEAQKNDPDSVWNFYRALTALRRDPEYHETVVYGLTEPYLTERENLMAYFRRGAAQTLLVIGNFQAPEQEIPLPGNVRRVLLNNLTDISTQSGALCLRPWQFVILDMEP